MESTTVKCPRSKLSQIKNRNACLLKVPLNLRASRRCQLHCQLKVINKQTLRKIWKPTTFKQFMSGLKTSSWSSKQLPKFSKVMRNSYWKWKLSWVKIKLTRLNYQLCNSKAPKLPTHPVPQALLTKWQTPNSTCTWQISKQCGNFKV